MPINDELQQELIREMILENTEGLDNFDREMLALEQGKSTPETPNLLFRVIHTIKGTAGCLGLTKIASVAHIGENLLSDLREGKLAITPPLVTTLLAYADALRQMLGSLEAHGNEGDVDYSLLLKELEALQSGKPVETPLATAPPPSVDITWGMVKDAPPAAAMESPGENNPAAANPAGETGGPASLTAAAAPTHAPPVADSAIRVNVDQLDKLMNLVGELVLARNQIVQHCSAEKDGSLLAASQRMNVITAELQESVMKTRMLPIGNVWAKFPRVVRDVAQELGKDVQLVMEGQETELDRTIIEAIKDPLTHIVRNAIDHGIETPKARTAAGKNAQGRLVLRAFHEGGLVNIEIVDDGHGINVMKVKQKAVEKGLLTSEQVARLNDREVFNLIFLPGFSTADKVTNVSGRGVGMDVVKTNIEKIGGSVDVLSDFGCGSTIKIKIPLTLAIIPALIVTSRGERFAIPQVSLLELVRIKHEQARKNIELLCDAPVYRLRGQLLPLCYLNKELALDHGAAGDATAQQPAADAVNLVVLQADGRQFGLVVDTINDTEEIVVKPLGKQLKGIACFAGATIMGDGRVALILDVLGLAQHANIVGEARDRALPDKTKAGLLAGSRQTLLLFDAGNGHRMAIPLSVVARLEEFPRASVECSGAQEVVQYRGQILPLIRVSDHVASRNAESASQRDPMQVVVYSEAGRSVGLIVGRITDIVEEMVTVRDDMASKGILGSAVIQEKITDLLDVPAVIRATAPAFYRGKTEAPLATGAHR